MKPMKSIFYITIFLAFISFTPVHAQKFKDLIGGHNRSVNDVAFLNSDQLLSIGSDGKFLLWDIPTESATIIHQQSSALFSMAIGLPYIALGDRNGTILIFKVQNDSIRLVQQKRLHSSGIDHIYFGTAHNQLLSVGYDGNAYIWDFINDWTQHLYHDTYPLYAGLLIDQDQIAAIAGKSQTLRLFQTENQFLMKAFQLHENTIRALAYHPTSHLMASADLNGKIILYNLQSLHVHSILSQLPQKPVRSLLFSPDGSTLIIGYKDGEVAFFQIDNEKLIHWIKNPAPLWSMALSPNGKQLAVALANGTIRIWKLTFLKPNPFPQVSSNEIPPPENIETNIPENPTLHNHRYALVIGNESYSLYQKDLSPRMNVDYARSDASLFAIYAEKVLGIPSHQIILGFDVTNARFQLLLNKITSIAMNDTLAEIYFFYAGHGLPDPLTKKPYLLPLDVPPEEVSSAIELQKVIDQLSSTQAKRVFLFIDACFSGGTRSNEDLIRHRGVYIKPKTLTLPLNTLLFSASTESERALAFPSAKHGLFTYFLLKALRSSTPATTYEQLVNEVAREVNKYAILIHNLAQHPTLLCNDPKWKEWRIW